MLLSVHVTSILFLVQFNNFAVSIGVTRSYSSHPFVCALASYFNLTEICHQPLTKKPVPLFRKSLFILKCAHLFMLKYMCID